MHALHVHLVYMYGMGSCGTCLGMYIYESINQNVAKFTDEQYTTINQSTAGQFDPRVFVNCLQAHIIHL